MMKYEYRITLKEGYEDAMRTEIEGPEKTLVIQIEARNRVMANRAVNAMLKNAPNIKDCEGVYIER